MKLQMLICNYTANLGQKPGMLYSSVEYVKVFSTLKKAKKYAEYDWGDSIKWQELGKTIIQSKDLEFKEYVIDEVIVDDI